MSARIFIQLMLVSLIPVALSVIFFLLEKKGLFRNVSYWGKQVILGVCFGLAAIFGTHFGVDVGLAIANARDAAPLCAGFLFGGPAGIIAGFIGAVERWIASSVWGIGVFSKEACSISVACAGLFAALMRKYFFEGRRPSVFMASFSALVMEVFHMTMIFLFNLEDPFGAFKVVRAITLPMMISNIFGTGLSTLLLAILSGKQKDVRHPEKKTVAQKIQLSLMICIIIAYLFTSGFTYILETQTAINNTNVLLSFNLEDVKQEISDTSDSFLLTLAHYIAEYMVMHKGYSLSELAVHYGLDEINIIDRSGHITESNVPEYLGFDMASGEQAAEFLVLLDGSTKEYVQPYRQITFDTRRFEKYAGVATDDGFIQIGYNGRQFRTRLNDLVRDITRNRRIGENGYVVIADEGGQILSGRILDQVKTLHDAKIVVVDKQEHTRFEADVLREPAFCMYAISEGYKIIAVLPVTEAMQDRDIGFFVNSFMEVLVFEVLFILIYLFVRKSVVNNIQNINGLLARISGGYLDVELKVDDTREFASLSDDINTTVNTLKQYIKEAEQRIDRELQVAKDIQRSALPVIEGSVKDNPRFDIYASMFPAKQVGGDFYDFYLLGENKLAFTVADVAGKGIPAALFMMSSKTMLKNYLESGMSVEKAMTTANQKLCESNESNMFLTAWMGVLDLRTGHVVFANAGHNKPLVMHVGGDFEYLNEKSGFVMAALDTVKYIKMELDLEPGDVIFLYTDGVPEATDSNGQLYGDDRLLDLVNSLPKDISMEPLCGIVKESVDLFVGEAPQFDDITMVAIRYRGNVRKGDLIDKQLELEAKLENVGRVVEFAEEEMKKVGCPMKTMMMVETALDEVFSNISMYAYPRTTGNARIRLFLDKEKKYLTVLFEDEGIPYDPTKKTDPDISLNAEERPIGGLGIFIVKKVMDSVSYERKGGKNYLTLRKQL